jgi:hypothetical protein
MAVRYFSQDSSLPSRALQVYLILIGAAHRRQTFTYGFLADHIEFDGAAALENRLETIAKWCVANQLPALTAIVVNKKSGTPEDGLGLGSAPLPAEHQKVFNFDWYSIYPPTAEELAAHSEP